LTVRTALSQGAEILSKAGVDAPRFTAELLLGHAMHCERVYFFAHPEQELREVEWLHYGRYLHERSQGKPTQYITKRQEFYGRDFLVTPAVLIPRPETEVLVEAVKRLRPDARRIVDVGTGSGAIAVSLGAAFACDISAAALAIACRNGATGLVQCDLLSAFADESFEVVASNPPYIASTEVLQREVQNFEPHLALFGGEDGLNVYRRLIPEAFRVLNPGGLLALELGFGQSESVVQLASAFRKHELINDLAQIPRVLVCEKPFRS